MLGPLRKFSTSIYAKILLGIIIIPFVFWGMGGTLRGGSKNVIVAIDNDKYQIKEFINFIKVYSNPEKKLNEKGIENMLTSFIGEKLIEKELEAFDIKLSDSSLSKLIRHQKDFKRENKFSRIEYEKFLLKNDLSAVSFERILSFREKKKQLFDFIGSGITSSKFLVNKSYNKINQKRYIEIINLNNIFKDQIKFTEDQIKTFYESGKEDFKEIYKSVKFLELEPIKVTGKNEFSNLFFEKVDEIDNEIVAGKNINQIIEKFNLEKANTSTFNKNGMNKNSKKIISFEKNLLKNIFNIKEDDPTILLENNNKYYIFELIKTDVVKRNIDNIKVKGKIISELEKQTKRELVSKIISEINSGNFKKFNFYSFAKEKNISIQEIKLDNVNDNKKLNKEIVKEVYYYPQEKIIVVHDINFTENYLIHIKNIETVSIKENTKEYKKYSDLSKIKISNRLFNTYDYYVKNKYKIDINYKALDVVKNFYIY